MNIDDVSKKDYPRLRAIWESAVRATHSFLSEADIIRMKPMLDEYFDAVELRCVKDVSGKIQAFCGVAEGNIGMLFVHAYEHGNGFGSALCNYAIENQDASKVDVNEQNPLAIGFYEHLGFERVGRSELDGQGQPFPLIHMELR